MKKRILILVFVVAAVAVIFLVAPHLRGRGPERLTVIWPEDLANSAQLDQRRAVQQASLSEFKVYHDFTYSDRREESGIDFSHKMVDDAGKLFQKVHYDHGNGVSVADIDNDGLYDLYFTTQVGENELWRNLGGGRFENVTASAGVAMKEEVSVTSSFGDIDNDGDQDLFVTTVRFGNRLYENDGTGRFTDISKAAGVDYVGHSSGAVFFDYDRDGLLDLFVANVGRYTTDEKVPVRGLTRLDPQKGEYSYYRGIGNDEAFMGHLYPDRYEQSILYRNLGGDRFEDVSESTGLVHSAWSGDATVVDGNEDGWPDLYVLSMQGNDEYYENVEGKRFERKTSSVFPKTPWGAMGVVPIDFNEDGRMDLFITDMHCDMWEADEVVLPGRESEKPKRIPTTEHLGTSGTSIFGNALFRNEGGGRYTDVAEQMNAETYWPWGVSSGDLNADGYSDLFVSSSMNYPFRYAVNKVLLNNLGTRFLDSEFILGVEPRRDDRVSKLWFEVDCATEEHRVCEESGAKGPIDVMGALGTRSSVIFDLDGDGDLDIVTNEFNDHPMVLISDLSERDPDLHFIKLKLVGTGSNRDGLGAVVRVRTGETTHTRQYSGKSGYLSQSAAPMYVGLGDAASIDAITVDWPSGKRQVVEGPIAANQQLEITER